MPEAITPRPSTSVILVRDALAGLETFMVRRHARSPVAPSAYVFPGGTVRDDDRDLKVEHPDQLSTALSQRSDVAVDAENASALYASAIRELFEEAGILLVRTADDNGSLLGVDTTDRLLQEKLESLRLMLQARQRRLTHVLDQERWEPAFDLLVPFSHWVTPSALAARFDTRFFVAELPPRQLALHDTIETSEGLWLRPSQVLEGDYETVWATAQHLRRLLPFPTVTQLLAFARTKPIRTIQPQLRETSSGVRVAIDPELEDKW
jgi:8-oxo-dGTP pyrophosphatase MutT (NUDIX family)